MAPRLMPARLATTSREVRSHPFSPMTAAAASMSAARVLSRLSHFGCRRTLRTCFAMEPYYTHLYFIQSCIIVWRMTTPPAADRIAAVLADQIDVRRKSVGMAAGVVSPAGRHVVVHGSTGSDAPLDGDTAFELASIGKVFTGLLFADAVRRGEVRLDDPVDTLLPGGMKAPTWKGRRLTLLHLATHTAGLPVHPPDVPTLADPRLADYSVDNLLQSLCAFTPTRPPGTWEYSNWDISVLGQLLALRAGVEFETLVEHRITRPLGMANTAIERTSRLRLSSGHS